MRPTRQHDEALDWDAWTHQMKEKELLRNEKATYEKLILLPVRPRCGAEKSLCFQAFSDCQSVVFEGDDELIVAFKNEVLTGNKTAGTVKQKKVYNFLSL